MAQASPPQTPSTVTQKPRRTHTHIHTLPIICQAQVGSESVFHGPGAVLRLIALRPKPTAGEPRQRLSGVREVRGKVRIQKASQAGRCEVAVKGRGEAQRTSTDVALNLWHKGAGSVPRRCPPYGVWRGWPTRQQETCQE